ncbi:hypothetical protein F183_A19090 [Bryobacterales bacterium F-183]|nr:hypothetical protein F183_A19090 [Bryobacterales bacterium F-183]
MKRDRTQRRLDQLRVLRHAPNSPSATETLTEILSEPSNYAAARAASLIEEAQLLHLAPQLVQAFHRFLTDAPKHDRGCEATTAIAKALYALDQHHYDVYAKGSRHKQPEGGFGTPTDSAQALRGICAMGLSQIRRPDVLDDLVRLLADDSPTVRSSAARAISCATTGDVAIPLLKLKLYCGDEEPDVLSECMAAMLAASFSRSVDTVLQQLESSTPGRSEAAAIALGSVRDERVFEVLHDKWQRTASSTMRTRILEALSMSRTQKGLDFLYDLVANETSSTAQAAAKALSIHRHDPRIFGRLQEIAGERKEIARVLLLAERSAEDGVD